jgi:hypothetical protein
MPRRLVTIPPEAIPLVVRLADWPEPWRVETFDGDFCEEVVPDDQLVEMMGCRDQFWCKIRRDVQEPLGFVVLKRVVGWSGRPVRRAFTG